MYCEFTLFAMLLLLELTEMITNMLDSFSISTVCYYEDPTSLILTAFEASVCIDVFVVFEVLEIWEKFISIGQKSGS